MMKTEFERIAGYEVSFEDYYNIIEPMYMATDLGKHEFVRTLNKARFALKTKVQLLSEIKKLARRCQKTCDHFTDYEAQKKLYELIAELKHRFGNEYEVAQGHSISGGLYPSKLLVYRSYDLRYIEAIELTA